MQNLFLAPNLSLVLCILIMLVLAVVIFQHRDRNTSSLIFFFLIIAAILWIFANLMANLSVGNTQQLELLFWTKASLVGPIFIPALLILFSNFFVEEKIIVSKFIYYLLIITTIIFLFFIPSSFNVEYVKVLDPDIPTFFMSPGKLYTFYSIYLIFGVIVSAYIIITNYSELIDSKKTQIKIVTAGLIGSIAVGVTLNAVLPLLGYSGLLAVGPLSITIFIFLTSYAIIKFQLLNVKLIIAEIVTYIIIIILTAEIFLSRSVTESIFRIAFLLVVIYGGHVLISNTKLELKQKKNLEDLTAKLQTANTHLKDLDKLKDDFLSMAAHELNTPLAAIEGYLSMILEEHIGGEVPAKIKKYLESMFTSSKRLSAIIHDMLNVSRIESGRIHIVYTDLQIEDVINQAITEIMSKAKEKKHALVYEKSDKKLPKTWFDLTRITEVLINLIGNAIKYTEPGGKIEVSAKADDKFITVLVKDNGRGIPEDRKKIVFDKFSQVDILKDEVKGTGLGMYIAKKFIELHKGKIWFDSSVAENDHGTTFFFTLPIIDKKPFDPHEGEGEVLH